ncbi:MAG: amidase [Alkalilacustris sp.]
MAISLPTTDQLLAIASARGLSLSRDDASAFRGIMAGTLASYRRLDQLPEPALPVVAPRTPGYRPPPHENPHNAWYRKTDIRSGADGLLSGKAVAIKDNICVAGVPLMNGSALLEGFVPDIDATVVTRILEAGGTIAGKAACEDLCFSGASHTNHYGPIRNPHKPSHSAGGSSGGSAALVAAGEVPMALGGDQGGSIRTPSAWCGVYGLKPTWGLVPSTGAMPISYSMDHLGPMCASVEDTARLLQVIAGHDGWDHRTVAARTQPYMEALGQGAAGLRIAVLTEGFAHPESDAGVSDRVRAAIEVLRAAGAEITEVSVPAHYDAPHVWTGIILEGAAEMMIRGNGFGSNVPGYYPTGFIAQMGRGYATRMDDVSDTVKMVMLLGEYLHDQTHGIYHAKAQNLRWGIRAAYDAVLAEHDAIVMPTIPFTATEIPAPDCPREDFIRIALDMQANTCPFDVTGHPAFTFPVALQDGLPVGMMAVGRHFDESTLIRIAEVVESAGDWRSH